MDMDETTTDSGHAEHDSALVVEPEPVGALIEVLPGLLVAYGELDLEALDGVEVLDLDVTTVPGLTDMAGASLTGANLLAQGAQSALHARGLVRLAPETLQALKTAHPVASGGWNLGTLAGKGGRFVQSVRWLPATSAQAVTVLAGLGPALALAAISAQASALASTAARIESKIDALRAELEQKDLDKLRVLLRKVGEIHDEVSQCGLENSATRKSIDKLAGDRDLYEMFEYFLRRALAHPTEDMKSATALIDTHGRMASDLSALTAVWRACDLVGLMQIGALVAERTEESVLRHRVQNLSSDLNKREKQVIAAVSSLRSWAHLLLIEEENPGLVADVKKRVGGAVKGISQRLPFGGAADVSSHREAVDMIDEVIDSYGDARLAAPKLPDPKIRNGDAETIQRLCEALRWLLPADEALLALVQIGKGIDHFVVTTSRWGLVTLNDLVKMKNLDSLAPLVDLRYVVDKGLASSNESTRSLDVVTCERVVPVEFTQIEGGTERSRVVDRTVCLLRTAMNLPDEERERDPLLRQLWPDHAELLPAAI